MRGAWWSLCDIENLGVTVPMMMTIMRMPAMPTIITTLAILTWAIRGMASVISVQ